MANAVKVPGAELLEVNGVRYEWNATFGAYWSTTGQPRALESDEVPTLSSVPKDANTLEAPRRAAGLSNDISGIANMLGLFGYRP